MLAFSVERNNGKFCWHMGHERCDQSVASNALRLRTSLLRGLKRDDDDDQDEEDDDDDDDSEELSL